MEEFYQPVIVFVLIIKFFEEQLGPCRDPLLHCNLLPLVIFFSGKRWSVWKAIHPEYDDSCRPDVPLGTVAANVWHSVCQRPAESIQEVICWRWNLGKAEIGDYDGNILLAIAIVLVDKQFLRLEIRPPRIARILTAWALGC